VSFLFAPGFFYLFLYKKNKKNLRVRELQGDFARLNEVLMAHAHVLGESQAVTLVVCALAPLGDIIKTSVP
jgi:hypothetical protein